MTVSKTNVETGETELSLIPRHAGPDPIIHYADNPRVSPDDPIVAEPDAFVTTVATLYFLVIDREGRHESGEPTRWTAPLKIRHQVDSVADERRVRLASSTPSATIRYTLDGSNPKEGQIYDAPFGVRDQAQLLSVYAEAGEASAKESFNIPANGDDRAQIVDGKPARLNNECRVSLDTTDKVFGVINAFKQNPATRFRGVIIDIGEGENAVTVRFQARAVSAQEIETTITALRDVLDSNQPQDRGLFL